MEGLKCGKSSGLSGRSSEAPRGAQSTTEEKPAESTREGNLGLEGAAGQGWFS